MKISRLNLAQKSKLQSLYTQCFFIAVLLLQYSLLSAQFAIGYCGAGEDRGHGIASDGQGGVFTTGEFAGTADFDPGPGVFNLLSNGGPDIFVARYTSTGNFLSAFAVGGPANDASLASAPDGQGGIYYVQEVMIR